MKREKYYQIGIDGQEIALEYNFNKDRQIDRRYKRKYINPILHKKLDYKLNRENKINYKKYRNLKLRIINEELDKALSIIDKLDKDYKEVINRTEFWERKTTLDYDFENWHLLKKVNGKLIRYYNDLYKIKNSIEKELN